MEWRRYQRAVQVKDDAAQWLVDPARGGHVEQLGRSDRVDRTHQPDCAWRGRVPASCELIGGLQHAARRVSQSGGTTSRVASTFASSAKVEWRTDCTLESAARSIVSGGWPLALHPSIKAYLETTTRSAVPRINASRRACNRSSPSSLTARKSPVPVKCAGSGFTSTLYSRLHRRPCVNVSNRGWG